MPLSVDFGSKSSFMRVLPFFLLFFCSSFLFASEERFTHLGKEFRVFRAQPEHVRLVWKNNHSKPLLSFRAAYRALEREGQKVAMLMNGGIFEPRQIPSGFYVEKGKIQNPLNLAAGKGNFFLQPNAIFYLKKEGEKLIAGVVESKSLSRWNREEKAKLWYAVQSGPALLLDGEKHPAFNRDSKSELLRNGVGVNEKGEVIFVIVANRESDCNLWTFADCFRALGCENALFLDGDISQMVSDPTSLTKSNRFATMFGVVEGRSNEDS